MVIQYYVQLINTMEIFKDLLFKTKLPTGAKNRELSQIIKCDSNHSTKVRHCPGTQLWKSASCTKVHTARGLVHTVKIIKMAPGNRSHQPRVTLEFDSPQPGSEHEPTSPRSHLSQGSLLSPQTLKLQNTTWHPQTHASSRVTSV